MDSLRFESFCAIVQAASISQPEDCTGIAENATESSSQKQRGKSGRKSRGKKQRMAKGQLADDAAQSKADAGAAIRSEVAPTITSTSTVQLESTASPAHASQAEPRPAESQLTALPSAGADAKGASNDATVPGEH